MERSGQSNQIEHLLAAEAGWMGYDVLDAIVQANLNIETLTPEELDGIVNELRGRSRRRGGPASWAMVS